MNEPDENQDFASLPSNLADQARAFQSAAAEIDRGTGPSPSEGSSPGGQGRDVEAWARRVGALIPAAGIDALPLVSNSTSEHEVHFRQSDGRAIKRTWAGFYGQVPVPRDGKLDRVNASPVEYLRRMVLQIAVFESDLKLEGVSVSDKPSMVIGQPAGEPSFVISQPWYERSERATTEEIEDLLRESGFMEVPGSYFGWYRPADGVVIVDAKPDNFIKTIAGIVPIDLQMAQFTPEQLTLAGLSGQEAGIVTAQSMNPEDEIRSGYWRYEPETMRLLFEPCIDKDRNPEYSIDLVRISTSGQLLDWILQLHGKGQFEDRRWLCSGYQVADFITVVQLLCKRYLNTNIQGAFSPFGEHRKIDWDTLTSKGTR